MINKLLFLSLGLILIFAGTSLTNIGIELKVTPISEADQIPIVKPDVAIPVVIGAGSLILWGCAELYERFKDAGIDEVMERF